MVVLYISCAFLLVVLSANVQAADENTVCVTPNEERARCIRLTDCSIIREEVYSFNPKAVEFAQDSQCGYKDREPLVCCGTVAYAIVQAEKRNASSFDSNRVFTNALPDRSACGVEREAPRLLGASVAAIDEFPWMALVRYSDFRGRDAGFKCAGSLINNKFVLTAAHCINTESQMIRATSVRLGEWQKSTEEDCVKNYAIETCSDPPIDVKIELEIPHSYYDSINGNNDIGLLRLEKTITYTDYIRPICLPPPDFPPPVSGNIMTVSGWGATERSDDSDFKLKVNIPIVATPDCSKFISNYTLLSLNQICAGGIKGKDACYGDSGGPLMRIYRDSTFQWYQEGIVSRGLGCSRSGIPGVYTRVSRYIAWIQYNIADDN